jgi:HTH-type transcriptional regulator, bacterioopsin transcriptional activator and related proteins
MPRTNSTQRPTVLVVEDDDQLARALIRSLSTHCAVVRAPSLADGLERIDAGGFDALICDWDLGDGKGREALIRCAALHPHAKRIVYSGRSYDEIARELPASVLQIFVQKPAAPVAIVEALGFATYDS